MKRLTISNPDEVILAIQNEIRRSADSRYDHRLHGVLLVAEGLSCPEAARLLGDAPRTVEYWVHRFEAYGFAGLKAGRRCGRPSRLGQAELKVVQEVLRRAPAESGMEEGGLWDGKLLSVFVARRFGVKLGVRQCQRLFRRLGFRLRKPRALIAHADPQQQAAYKKTAGMGKRSKR